MHPDFEQIFDGIAPAKEILELPANTVSPGWVEKDGKTYLLMPYFDRVMVKAWGRTGVRDEITAALAYPVITA